MDHPDYFPFGVPPATTTRNIIHGAYHWAKVIEAAENAPAGFQREICCPGAPKVYYHLLCTPNRLLRVHYSRQCHYCLGLASSIVKARPLHKVHKVLFFGSSSPPQKRILASSLQYVVVMIRYAK